MAAQPITIERSRSALPLRRCRCRDCGAHTMTIVGQTVVEGSCSTCGSFDLLPVDEAEPDRHRRFDRDS